MKHKRWFSVAIPVILLLALIVIPASAQLGDTDTSTIYVQNVSGTDGVSVTVTFIAEDGTQIVPTALSGSLANPFTLDDGEAVNINTEDISTSELPTGRYSAMISATGEIVAVAQVEGYGTKQFTGSYTGFTQGTTVTYLASVSYNYYGWYGMISVMNLGQDPADVTVELYCSNPEYTGPSGVSGTLTATDIPSYASHTFVLKNEIPTGFAVDTVCASSAKIISDQNVVVVNNQNKPILTPNGYTNSFESSPTGASTLYIPQLQTNYPDTTSSWVSNLSIIKLNAGSTTVTVDYSDTDTDTVVVLTDEAPSAQLFMPTYHPTAGRYSAVITTDPPMNILASVGNTEKMNKNKSNGILGVSAGSGKVAVPVAMKQYFGWVTAINCQNIGSTPTTLNFEYFGYTPVEHPTTPLNQGDSIQVFVPNEAFLPDAYIGGVVITANATGAEFACSVGNTKTGEAAETGDWSHQYNAPDVTE